ncbi:MAG: hypothetical protein DBX61_06120 [Clostridiales bacterium]|nr:MAG: hypothetical protein DBX61_06120 [Clostridiales bacterium]
MTAINWSSQTKAKIKVLKKKNAAKHRTNEVRGMLCGKNVVFPPLFLKKRAGFGAEPHIK